MSELCGAKARKVKPEGEEPDGSWGAGAEVRADSTALSGWVMLFFQGSRNLCVPVPTDVT